MVSHHHGSLTQVTIPKVKESRFWLGSQRWPWMVLGTLSTLGLLLSLRVSPGRVPSRQPPPAPLHSSPNQFSFFSTSPQIVDPQIILGALGRGRETSISSSSLFLINYYGINSMPSFTRDHFYSKETFLHLTKLSF